MTNRSYDSTIMIITFKLKNHFHQQPDLLIDEGPLEGLVDQQDVDQRQDVEAEEVDDGNDQL
jgi:hypothetical protein